MDSDLLAGFRDLLDPVNALADGSPGFIWRLQTDEGNATSLRIFEDSSDPASDQLVNMSVWESADALWDFVYSGDHHAVMRRRREWFERMAELFVCVWWIPAGHLPQIPEAEERLTVLREHGPTSHSFTFKQRFEAPSFECPELVVFDCDGVLVDSEPATCVVMAEIISELGLPTTPEDCMRDYVGDWWPDTERKIAAKLGRPLPDDFEETYRTRQDEALSRGVDPVSGVVELIDAVEAAGIRTCVASNGPHSKMEITLAGAGLRERFEGRIFSSADVARGKPAPDLFEHVAARMDAEPARCVVIEDSPLGIRAARTAGMAALGYTGHQRPERLQAAGAPSFDSMADVPALLGLDRAPSPSH